MHEPHPPGQPSAGRLVDHLHPARFRLLEFGGGVIRLQAEVMQPFPYGLQESGDAGIGASGLD